MWMRIVVEELEIFVFERKDVLDLGVDLHGRKGSALPAQLEFCLLQVVAVQVGISKGMDELSRLQATNLCDHHRKQGIGGNVKGYAEEDVRASLVQLAGEFPVSHIKLEQGMARRQGHVVHVGHVPGTDNMPSAVRLCFDLMDEVFDLVDFPAFTVRPVSPLVAIDRAQIAIFVCPLIPDADFVVLEVLDVGVPFQKPEQFDDDGPEVQLFGGDQRETLLKVEPHLVAKNADGARASTVGFCCPVVKDVLHQIVVLLHGKGDCIELASWAN